MLSQIQKILKPSRTSGRLLITYYKGEASAVKDFSTQLNLTPFVLTPNMPDAESMTAGGINAIAGSLGKDVEGSKEQFSIVVVPGHILANDFNLNDVQNYNLDWQHVLEAGQYIGHKGLMVYLAAKDRFVARHEHTFMQMSRSYERLEVFLLDKDTLGIIGVRRNQIQLKSDPVVIRQLKSSLTMITAQPPALKGEYELPVIAKSDKAWFRSKRFDPRAMEAVISQRITAEIAALNREWFGWRIPTIEPIGRLPSVLYAYIAASGYLPQRRLVSPKTGHTCVILGLIKRKKSVYENDEVDAQGDVSGVSKIEENNFKTLISVTDLTAQEVKVVDVNSPKDMLAFIEEWQQTLGEIVQAEYPPIYDLMDTPYIDIAGQNPTFKQWAVDVIDKRLSPYFYKGFNNRPPQMTVPQRHTVASIALTLLGEDILQVAPPRPLLSRKAVLLNASTGVGKTLMTATLIELLSRNFALNPKGRRGKLKLSASPGKWPVSAFVTTRGNLENICKEIHAAAPLLQAMKVTNVKELMEALTQAKFLPSPVVMVIPRSMLSQTQKIQPAALLGDFRHKDGLEIVDGDKIKVVARCPNCNEQIHFRKEIRADLITDDPSKSEFIQLCLDELIAGDGLSAGLRGKKCENCGSPLYKEVRTAHYALSKRMKREFKKVRNAPLAAVIDEAHEDKSENSKCGWQMGVIASTFEKVIAATASPFNGKASSIFFLNYRLFSSFRRNWKPDDLEQFVKLYGVTRRVWNSEKQAWNKANELPNLSAELAVSMMGDYCYLNEESSGFVKPPRSEFPLFITPTLEEKAAHDALLRKTKARIETEGDAHNKRIARTTPQENIHLRLFPSGMHHRVLAEFSPAWSCPTCLKKKFGEDPCKHNWVEKNPKTENEEVIPIFDETWTSSKELALIDLVQQEKKLGRTPLILCFFTGQYGSDLRLEDVFRRHGLKALNAKKVQAEKVEATVNRAGLEGFDCVVGNLKRMSSGMNLIGTPTIIFYEHDWKANITYQAAGRSHRPTQTRPCKNYYMVMKAAAEVVVLARTAESMSTMGLANGTLPDMPELMAAIGHNADFTELIVKGVSETISGDIASAFSQLNRVWEERYGATVAEEVPVQTPIEKHMIGAPTSHFAVVQMAFFEEPKKLETVITVEETKAAKQTSFFDLFG